MAEPSSPSSQNPQSSTAKAPAATTDGKQSTPKQAAAAPSTSAKPAEQTRPNQAATAQSAPPKPPASNPTQAGTADRQSTASVVVTVTHPHRDGWRHRWLRGLQLLGLAILAAGWGILTHLAIAQIPPPAPMQSAQPSLHLVAPVVERVFHGISAWDMTENGELGEAQRDRQKLGHFPYAESLPSQLMVIGSYTAANEQRFEQMQEAAGLALLEMIDAARREGIWLVPISGFRTYEHQKFLFDSKIERVGSPERAAHTVAPPGYSEHHTGMAVDLADGLARALDLSLAFGDTDAYRWLDQNAQRFGFELSFPPDNAQGISYEPWHWRYVGTDAAIATFAQGRSMTGPTATKPSMQP